jgi:hypothetical protein
MKKIISLIFTSLALITVSPSTSFAAWTYYTHREVYTVASSSPTVIGVELSASPSSLTLPSNSTTLTWTTSGSPDSCVASNAWSGAKSASGGSEVISSLVAGSYLFEITCSKAGSSDATDSALVVVSSAPTPTGALTASSCTIASGASSCSNTVSWTTSDLTANPTSITRNTGSPSSFTPSPLSSGSQSTTLGYGTTEFYLYHNSVLLAQATATASCASGSSWNGSACQAVVVTPSVSLSVAPSSIFSGGSATLSWTSANVSSCTASASPLSSSWTGSRSTSSSYPHESTGSLYANTTFTLSCTGVNGSASDSETVTVLPDTGSEVAAALTANPERIALGESSTLSWTSNNATSCSGIGFSTGGAISGSIPVSPTVNTTYTVSCTDGSSSASDQATVSLRRKFLFIEF